MKTVDYLIIGAGIIGINVALTLKRRYPDASVCVVDKEARLGLHGSGRNSGVIHAGFYYTADSLKARFTREGNRTLKEFIRRRQLPLNECGKLVVAQNEAELKTLDELLERGIRNGVKLFKISADDAREIEPRAKTSQYALWSPDTATADPLRVLQAFHDEVVERGVELCLGQRFVGCDKNRISLSHDGIEAGYVINTAGLYADKVAHAFGFGRDYMIFPFKGLYLKSHEPIGSFRTNIYPVPDLRNPFLGVHVTVTVDGHSKIGPTAIPAFWREQYKGGTNFEWDELFEILHRGSQLMLHADFDFRRLAYEELRKYQQSHLVRLTQELAAGLKPESFKEWGAAGIRAQLLNVKKRSLVMDFYFEGDDRSFHVLNSVSPGWTCAIPFSEYLVDRIDHLRLTGSLDTWDDAA